VQYSAQHSTVLYGTMRHITVHITRPRYSTYAERCASRSHMHTSSCAAVTSSLRPRFRGCQSWLEGRWAGVAVPAAAAHCAVVVYARFTRSLSCVLLGVNRMSYLYSEVA
ncbi:unnamed protein product, partial [Sphacelaria rigidula]